MCVGNIITASDTDRVELLGGASATAASRSYGALSGGVTITFGETGEEVWSKFHAPAAPLGKETFLFAHRQYSRYLQSDGSLHISSLHQVTLRALPKFKESYALDKNPAAAYYIAQIYKLRATDASLTCMAATPFCTPYHLIGSVLCGWFYPRFSPTYRCDEDALEYLRLAHEGCTDEDITHNLEVDVRRFEGETVGQKRLFRGIAIASVLGTAAAFVVPMILQDNSGDEPVPSPSPQPYAECPCPPNCYTWPSCRDSFCQNFCYTGDTCKCH